MGFPWGTEGYEETIVSSKTVPEDMNLDQNLIMALLIMTACIVLF